MPTQTILHMGNARFFQEVYVRNALVMTGFRDECGSIEKDSDLVLVHTICSSFFLNATFVEENSST